MGEIKALAFDVGGSVFDWKSAVKKGIESLAKIKSVSIDSEEFAMGWRLRLFQILMQVKTGALPRMNADQILRYTLDDLLTKFPGLDLSDSERDQLMMVWHKMEVWEEFPEALEKLKTKYKVFVLTILSMAIAVDCSKHNGITWDAVISCEFLNHYKQDPGAYIQGAALLGLKPEEVMMVAVHPSDIESAQKAGMKAAFVEPKSNEPDVPGLSFPPNYEKYDYCAKTFMDLATQLCG
jgi:2-haloacid dehalogenase